MNPSVAVAAGQFAAPNSVAAGGGGGMYQDGPREMYPIICAECGNDAMVPFRPRGDRPVYCSDCFSRMRAESSSGF